MTRSLRLIAAACVVLLTACGAALDSASAQAGAQNKPAGPPPSTQPKASGEFPDNWYYHNNNERLAELRKLVGKAPPALAAKSWIGSPQTLADIKGKVVVVDFWGTWCPPCRASIPHNIDMVKKYKDDLVFIGVHDSKRGSDKMAAMAEQQKINYPLAIDDNRKSEVAYQVSFWPTYVVIDRKGIVRAAGLEPGSVEKVVHKLIQEKAE